jgi:hypothetical protein
MVQFLETFLQGIYRKAPVFVWIKTEEGEPVGKPITFIGSEYPDLMHPAAEILVIAALGGLYADAIQIIKREAMGGRFDIIMIQARRRHQ